MMAAFSGGTALPARIAVANFSAVDAGMWVADVDAVGSEGASVEREAVLAIFYGEADMK